MRINLGRNHNQASFNIVGMFSCTSTLILRIVLAGEEHTITWTQRHFMRLIALYDSTQ